MYSSKGNFLLPIRHNKVRNYNTNRVYLFTNARDEPNIAEWIVHHLLLGFDKIVVFDHLSKDPIASKLINNFEGKVIIKRIGGVGNIKLPLMKKAVILSEKENADWMLYLDADEYLLLNACDNIKIFLDCYKFADALGVNWLMFGSSNHVKQPEGLITENFLMSEPRIDQHVKSFVRPSEVINILNPHYYVINNPNKYYATTNNRMNMSAFNRVPKIFTKVSAYIAHYVIQSEEEYYRRKGRPMDDGTGIKTGLYSDLHKTHNVVVNNQLQHKYSKRIKDYLEKYGIKI
jgi:hypothetical protein